MTVDQAMNIKLCLRCCAFVIHDRHGPRCISMSSHSGQCAISPQVANELMKQGPNGTLAKKLAAYRSNDAASRPDAHI